MQTNEMVEPRKWRKDLVKMKTLEATINKLHTFQTKQRCHGAGSEIRPGNNKKRIGMAGDYFVKWRQIC